jgi:hypothetical protein
MAQFEKIVERALSLQDESKASFALDSLFGGEASKLLMLLKQSGKSYRDLMDEQRRYNLVTKEGAEGAMEGNRAITNLRPCSLLRWRKSPASWVTSWHRMCAVLLMIWQSGLKVAVSNALSVFCVMISIRAC